jgi:LPS-assembly protein
LHAKKDLSGIVFWEWDSTKLETDQAAFTIHYQPSPNKIINLNYYWLKYDPQQTDYDTNQTGSLNQVDFSFLWPLKMNWHLLSLYRYNFQQKQTVEILSGLEYNGCCMALQLIGSRYLQSNNSFYPEKYATGAFAQVVFKGLSALPFNNPDGKLRQKIIGYTPLSDRQRWLNSPGKSHFPAEEIPLY